MILFCEHGWMILEKMIPRGHASTNFANPQPPLTKPQFYGIITSLCKKQKATKKTDLSHLKPSKRSGVSNVKLHA